MKFIATVKFGKSRSTNYRAAVNLAEALGGYSVSGDGRDLEHRVSIEVPMTDIASIRSFLDLVQTVCSWKSTEVDIQTDGLPGYWELLNSIQMIDQCYREREQTGLGDSFCLTADSSGKIATFGCRKLQGVGFHGAANRVRPWTDFGELTADRKKFRADKDEILRILEKSSLNCGCHFCPSFDQKRIKRCVAELPDSIDIESDERFDIEEGDPATGRRPRVVLKQETNRFLNLLTMPAGLGNRTDETKKHGRDVPDTTFSEIVGQDYAIEQIRSLIQLPLSHPDHFEALGLKPPKGILLYGPPGNGKTMLARAAAAESNANLEIIAGPELRSKYVGESERLIREVFERASSFAPSIILFDEIDSVAGNRDEMHSTTLGEVTQLLILLDGLRPLQQVVLIGTTNRPESVDPAMRRPGRLDYMIKVEPPNEEAREKLICLGLARGQSDIPAGLLKSLATETAGWSAAEVTSLVREAKLVAVKRAISTGTPAVDTSVVASDLEIGFAELSRKRQIS
jgi:transitional endoplasmic reticulum ATPase